MESREKRFWQSDDGKVTIRLCQARCEVAVTLAYLQHKVIHLLTFGHDGSYMCVRDLDGCGHTTGIQGLGFGTLAVNTALQSVASCLRPDATITSSALIDPTDYVHGAPPIQETIQRRIRFWRRFNYEIGPADDKGTYHLSGNAGALCLVTEGQAGPNGEYPRFVPIDQFVLGSPG